MSAGAGPARHRPAQPLEHPAHGAGEIGPPHRGPGLEGVVGVHVHDPEAHDRGDVLRGPTSPRCPPRPAARAAARRARAVTLTASRAARSARRGRGGLRDAAVLLGLSLEVEGLLGGALARQRLLVGGCPGQHLPVHLPRLLVLPLGEQDRAEPQRHRRDRPRGSSSSVATARAPSPRATSRSARARRRLASSGAASRAVSYSPTAVSVVAGGLGGAGGGHVPVGDLELEPGRSLLHQRVVRGHLEGAAVAGEGPVHVALAKGRRARADEGRQVVRAAARGRRERRRRRRRVTGPQPRVAQPGLRRRQARAPLEDLLGSPGSPPRSPPSAPWSRPSPGPARLALRHLSGLRPPEPRSPRPPGAGGSPSARTPRGAGSGRLRRRRGARLTGCSPGTGRGVAPAAPPGG